MRSTITPGKRRKLRTLALVLAAGAVYAALAARFGGISCPFRLVTGLKCPGCGVTTLLLCLLRGDWQGAWAANPFLLATSPLLAVILWRFWWVGTRPGRPWQALAAGYIGALILWGVLRNYAVFSTLF